MTLADKLTFSRIVLAPVFFILYFLPEYVPALFPVGAGWTGPVLWGLYILASLTDMFDGMAARSRHEVSGFGKLFDPFADTLMQITVFLCFVLDGVFPSFLFLLVLYREFGIQFIRNLMLKKGVAMGARISGKIKTVTYITAAGTALFGEGFRRLGICESVQPALKTAALVIFCVSALLSIVSFFDYLLVYRNSNDVPGKEGSQPR